MAHAYQNVFCIIGVIFLLSWSSNVEAKSLPVVQVGIVRDGPSELVPSSVISFRRKFSNPPEGEFEVRFPMICSLMEDGRCKGVKQAIDRVLAQPRVNLVIALRF